jgi:hypothetical protein
MQDPTSEGATAPDCQLWLQYRHASEQRNRLIRFALGFLGVFSGALAWLLLQDAGPGICTALGALMSLLCVALGGLERGFAQRQRRLEMVLQSVRDGKGNQTGGKGRVKSDPSDDFGGGLSGKRDSWPIYGIYAAFGLLGVFFAGLPFWVRPIIAKPAAQTPHNEPQLNAAPVPGWPLPAMTPFTQRTYLPPRTPPLPFGTPRPFSGGTPMQNQQPPRFPMRTPGLPQTPGTPVVPPAPPPSSPVK